MSQFHELTDRLGVSFESQEILREALTHRSYLNEHPEAGWNHNERLEFLGDAVLELIVTEALFRQFPQAEEGAMTNWRAALVRTESLAEVAEQISLDDFIQLSRGEAGDTGRARLHIMANAVEALIGALFLDQGFVAAERFVHKNILPKLPEIIEKGLEKDAKSLFQEYAQEHVGITPTYEVVDSWGPDHAKQFRIIVMLGEERVAEGEGASKQDAQQAAAEQALKVKGWG